MPQLSTFVKGLYDVESLQAPPHQPFRKQHRPLPRDTQHTATGWCTHEAALTRLASISTHQRKCRADRSLLARLPSATAKAGPPPLQWGPLHKSWRCSSQADPSCASSQEMWGRRIADEEAAVARCHFRLRGPSTATMTGARGVAGKRGPPLWPGKGSSGSRSTNGSP